MKQKVSLVLSGGGARGIAHIGVIEELEKQGYEINSISGTSMGALVGGVYALGKMEELKDWLFSLDRIKVFQLIDFTFSSQGLVKGDKVFNTMKKFIADDNIENLKINFAAVATDIINREEVVFTKGSVFDAIRASVAIPTVITPVKTENGLLIDGGVINNIPIKHVKRSKNDLLIVVDVNAMIPVSIPDTSEKEVAKTQSIYKKKIQEFSDHLHKIMPAHHKEKMGYFDLINKTINLMMSKMSQESIDKYSPDVMVKVSHEICSVFDFFRAEELVEMGRYSAVNSLEDYKNQLSMKEVNN